MPQYAFILTYGPESPDTPDVIPMRITVRFVDTDQNALSEHEVSFTVPAGSNASQIQSAAATAVRAIGPRHGYSNLGANAVIAPALTRG